MYNDSHLQPHKRVTVLQCTTNKKLASENFAHIKQKLLILAVLKYNLLIVQ